MPRVVQREIEAFGEDDVTVRTVRALPWLRVIDTPPIPDTVSRYKLDPGEAAVLAWALAHPDTAVILDDGPARRCASELGIPVRGTVNLVLSAKRAGMIPLVQSVLDDLLLAGLYVSPRVIAEALALAGE
jgi:predicted nucleic acid-binding protein